MEEIQASGLSARIEFAGADHAAGSAFWSQVDPAIPLTERDGPSRVVVGVHRPGTATDGVIRSPAGIPYRTVPEPAEARPSAQAWPDGHRSRLDQITLDIPPADFAAELDFWEDLTGWPRRAARLPEFVRLAAPARGRFRLLLQRLQDSETPARAHLDIATDRRPAEVARLVEAGAVAGFVGEIWTALRPPSGPLLCVTDRDPDTGALVG